MRVVSAFAVLDVAAAAAAFIAAKGPCSQYFGPVSTPDGDKLLVTVVDPDLGITAVSESYCDSIGHSYPCTFIHYAGLHTKCISPGTPDGCHRYIKVTYDGGAADTLEQLNMTGSLDASDAFITEGANIGAHKDLVKHVVKTETHCFSPPADEPVACQCPTAIVVRMLATVPSGAEQSLQYCGIELKNAVPKLFQVCGKKSKTVVKKYIKDNFGSILSTIGSDFTAAFAVANIDAEAAGKEVTLEACTSCATGVGKKLYAWSSQLKYHAGCKPAQCGFTKCKSCCNYLQRTGGPVALGAALTSQATELCKKLMAEAKKAAKKLVAKATDSLNKSSGKKGSKTNGTPPYRGSVAAGATSLFHSEHSLWIAAFVAVACSSLTQLSGRV
jgi:hypothetical protein